MKSFIIFCSSSILLYQITRYNKFLKKKNKNKNKKIDGIIFFHPIALSKSLIFNSKIIKKTNCKINK